MPFKLNEPINIAASELNKSQFVRNCGMFWSHAFACCPMEKRAHSTLIQKEHFKNLKDTLDGFKIRDTKTLTNEARSHYTLDQVHKTLALLKNAIDSGPDYLNKDHSNAVRRAYDRVNARVTADQQFNQSFIHLPMQPMRP